MEAEDSRMVDPQSEMGCMLTEEERIVDMRMRASEMSVAYMGLHVGASTYADTGEEMSRRTRGMVDRRMVGVEQIAVEAAPEVVHTLGGKAPEHSDMRQTEFQGQQVDEVFVSALRP
jgi:hypothetical protein